MSRAAGLCKYCGGPKRGRAARPAAPIAQCSSCGNDVCGKHCDWVDDWYKCHKCIRAGRKADDALRKIPVLTGEEVISRDNPDAPDNRSVYLPDNADSSADRD